MACVGTVPLLVTIAATVVVVASMAAVVLVPSMAPNSAFRRSATLGVACVVTFLRVVIVAFAGLAGLLLCKEMGLVVRRTVVLLEWTCFGCWD